MGLCLVLVGSPQAAELASRPGVFDVDRAPITIAGRRIHATYVRPVASRHAGYFVVFATGDGGWHGTSELVFEHLAEQGYAIAGFSVPEAFRSLKRSGKRIGIAPATARLAGLFARVRRDLSVPADEAMIVIGFSRGASVVVFTAVMPALRVGLAGAVAIGLTRESDYLRAPNPAQRLPEIQVDRRNRVLIYPALKLIGSTPLAVIQATGDGYVPSGESRRLLGPDTPTLRLYQVDARNHMFWGGRDRLLQDLDDALSWIERSASSAPGTSQSKG